MRIIRFVLGRLILFFNWVFTPRGLKRDPEAQAQDPLAHLSAVSEDYEDKREKARYKKCVPVSLGHVDARVPKAIANRRDELGTLAADFNAMADRLQQLISGREQLMQEISRDSSAWALAGLYEAQAIVDPRETRRVLGLALSATLNKPIQETRFGVFRM